MSDNFSLEISTANEQQGSYIKVMGVGGAGTNAVNHMFNKGITGVDFIVCNTDQQSLNNSPVQTKIKIGKGGLGAGNKPEIAKKAAIDAEDKIKAALSNNTHMLFIAAGMGGGTGTGASPEIARIAKEIEIDEDYDEQIEEKDEILVVAVVTIPFSFEGKKRKEQARMGIEKLRQSVDSIIVVNTDRLQNRGNMSMNQAFALADDILLTAAKGISEIMTANAYIHVDFRDVQSVMRHSGVALMGSGVGEGEDRARKAIEAAATSDLLNDNDLRKTKNVLLYISYSSKEEYLLQTDELQEITSYVQEITNSEVDMIWGCGTDDSLEGKVVITLVATGFEPQAIYTIEHRDILQAVKPVIDMPVVQKPIPEEPIIEQLPIQSTPNVASMEPKQEQQPIIAKKPTGITPSPVIENQEPAHAPQTNMLEDIKIKEINNQPKTQEVTSEYRQGTVIVLSEKETEQDTSLFEDNTPHQTTHVSEQTPEEVTFEHATNQPTLKDITSGYINPESQNNMTNSDRQQRQSERDKRIAKIHDILKAGNVDFLERLRPSEPGYEGRLSEQQIPSTRLGLNSDGDVIVCENPVMNSGVD